MPANNRLRLDDHQDLPPTRPQARQDDPEKAIGHPKRWPGSLPIEGGKLLSQGKVLQMQRRATEESLADGGKNELNGRVHVKDAIQRQPERLGFLRPIGFMGTTGAVAKAEEYVDRLSSEGSLSLAKTWELIGPGR